LNNTTLKADNNTKNSDKSEYYQAVMIYQSMSGDSEVGASEFSMTDGKIINKNGDIFFVNNTRTTIDLTNVKIKNKDSEGIFLRAAAAGWGNEGSNGGDVMLNATKQKIKGAKVAFFIRKVNRRGIEYFTVPLAAAYGEQNSFPVFKRAFFAALFTGFNVLDRTVYGYHKRQPAVSEKSFFRLAVYDFRVGYVYLGAHYYSVGAERVKRPVTFAVCDIQPVRRYYAEARLP